MTLDDIIRWHRGQASLYLRAAKLMQAGAPDPKAGVVEKAYRDMAAPHEQMAQTLEAIAEKMR